MGIPTKLEYEWAEDGDTTEPSDEKKQEGWVGGDRPSIEYFNWLDNRQDQKINDVVENGVSSVYDGTDPHGAIATRLWGITNEAWGFFGGTNDTVSIGTGYNAGLEAYYTSTGEPRVIMLESDVGGTNQNKLHIIDPRAMTYTSSSALAGLDTSGSETWEAIGMCTDGTSVYVVFRDSDAAPDEYVVQAYNLSDFAVKTGWPATGTALSGTGTQGEVWMRPCGIIVANSTQICIACPWITIADATSTALALVAMADGTIDGEGAGDGSSPGNADEESTGCLVSDGTYIYYGVYSNNGGQGYVCTAEIAEIGGTGAGVGGAWAAAFSGAVTGPFDMCLVGEGVFATSWGGATDRIIFASVYSKELETLVQGTDADAQTGDKRFNEFAGSMCFDGMKLWIRGYVNNTSADFIASLTSFDVGQLYIDTTKTANQDLNFVDHCKTYPLNANVFEVGAATAGSINYTPIAFDGRDVWMTEEEFDQNGNLKAHRLARANNRG